MATTQKPEQGKQVAKRDPVDPRLGLIRSRLERLQPSFAEVLPSFLTPERMVKLALLSINRQPDLLACTAESIAESVMQISAWGLELGRTAHLVAFGRQCTAIADYKGKIELAIRGASITSCRARIVYEKDAFEVEYGLTERVIHKPTWRDDPGKPVGVYAVVVLPSGESKFELMSSAQVEKIRARSRAKDKGPWATDPEEMWKKTVVHRLLKMVPQNPMLAAAFEADEEERAATAEAVMAGTYKGLTPVRPADLDYGEEPGRNTLAEQVDRETGEIVEAGERETVRMTGGGAGYPEEDTPPLSPEEAAEMQRRRDQEILDEEERQTAKRRAR